MDPELKAFLEEYYDPAGREKSHQPVKINTLTPAKKIAIRLIDARHRKYLTQANLAKLCGLSQPMIARFENGKGNPSLRSLLRVCHALELELVLK